MYIKVPVAVRSAEGCAPRSDVEFVLLSPVLAKDRQRDGNTQKRGEESWHPEKARPVGRGSLRPTGRAGLLVRQPSLLKQVHEA
jgi:hypothetical protein